MKVLNLCVNDWANFAQDNANALRSVGVDIVSLKREPHVCKYEGESEVASMERIIDEIKRSDVIQFFHDDLRLFEAIAPHLKKKIVIPYHTSTLYRRDYTRINYIMNPVSSFCINAMPEFMGLGAKSETYIVGAYDTDNHRPKPKKIHRPIMFGHFPSNPIVKGFGHVESVMISLCLSFKKSIEFDASINRVSHAEQIDRIRSVDIYIEMLTEKDALGSEYGDWGITALEASSLGKYVLTCNRHRSEYSKAYGIDIGQHLGIISTRQDLRAKVIDLAMMTTSEIESLQTNARKWVVENHSYKATGERLKKLIA